MIFSSLYNALKNPSPINQRRWQAFTANRRATWSFWIFLVLFFVSLFSEFIANDKPLLIFYDNELYSPTFKSYPETAPAYDRYYRTGIYTWWYDAEKAATIKQEPPTQTENQ